MEGNNYFNMTANDTLTCAARNIQGPVELSFSPYVPLVARCLLIIYYMLVAFFGTVLNCFVFYLVCRYKELQTLSFVFAIQNIACNIIGSVLVAVSFVSVIFNKWLLGETMCYLIGGLHFAINLLRGFFLSGLVLDRFCSVFLTFSYPRYQVKVLWFVGIASYLGTALIVLIPSIMDCYTFSITSWLCRIASTCSSQCAIARHLNGFLVFLPMRIIPLIMYCILYYKGRKARKAMQRIAASVALKENKNRRASITFFLMFLSVFLVSAPSGLTSAALNIAGLTTDTTESVWFYIVDVIALNVFILSHVADPIFILRNQDVREVISRIKWIPFLKDPTKSAFR